MAQVGLNGPKHAHKGGAFLFGVGHMRALAAPPPVVALWHGEAAPPAGAYPSREPERWRTASLPASENHAKDRGAVGTPCATVTRYLVTDSECAQAPRSPYLPDLGRACSKGRRRELVFAAATRTEEGCRRWHSQAVAAVPVRLYDCSMVTQITLNTEPLGFDSRQGHSNGKLEVARTRASLIRTCSP